MTAIWMTFNFVLIVLAFYLILHLYQRIRLIQQSDPKRIADDIQQVFETYLEEVRKENDRLIADLKKSRDNANSGESAVDKVRHVQPPAAAVDRETVPEPAGKDGTFKKILDGQIRHTDKEGGTEDLWVPPVDEITDSFEESLFVQAMKMHQEGLTVTEIAKKLNRGKGEIELLLKFQGHKNS